MSTIEGADVAGLLDMLGHPAGAGMVRWSEAREYPSLPEFEDLQDQLDVAVGALVDLESLLCKACAKKWNKA